MKQAGVLLVTQITLLIVFMSATSAHAQAITTPYWCGSYYSSVPCNSNNNYNYNYNYNNNYNSNYGYSYPYYNYYPPTYYYYPTTYYNYTYPAPSCTITATNSYDTSYGYTGYSYTPITLSWSSSNATSAYISPNVGSVSTYGSVTVYPQ